MSCKNIQDLPYELLVEIMKRMCCCSLACLRDTSSRFKKIVLDYLRNRKNDEDCCWLDPDRYDDPFHLREGLHGRIKMPIECHKDMLSFINSIKAKLWEALVKESGQCPDSASCRWSKIYDNFLKSWDVHYELFMNETRLRNYIQKFYVAHLTPN